MRKASIEQEALSFSPRPVFLRCRCGALVTTRVFVHGTQDDPPHWKELGKAVTPCLGEDHVCRKEEREREDHPGRREGSQEVETWGRVDASND